MKKVLFLGGAAMIFLTVLVIGAFIFIRIRNNNSTTNNENSPTRAASNSNDANGQIDSTLSNMDSNTNTLNTKTDFQNFEDIQY